SLLLSGPQTFAALRSFAQTLLQADEPRQHTNCNTATPAKISPSAALRRPCSPPGFTAGLPGRGRAIACAENERQTKWPRPGRGGGPLARRSSTKRSLRIAVRFSVSSPTAGSPTIDTSTKVSGSIAVTLTALPIRWNSRSTSAGSPAPRPWLISRCPFPPHLRPDPYALRRGVPECY